MQQERDRNALHAERDRIARLLERIGNGAHAGDVSHADIAEFQHELARLNALLSARGDPAG